MRTPTEFEVNQLFHTVKGTYDPVKARAYYLRTRQLKGQQPRSGEELPRRTREQTSQSVRDRQRKELTAQIANLETKFKKLEALIRVREHEEASENRKFKAKKERAQKSDKPGIVVERAVIAHENARYRERSKQELRHKARTEASSSGGDSKQSSNNSGSIKQSSSDLKALATRVRGQLAVAKQKLVAL